MKICARCKQEKELSEFGNLKKSGDGKRYDCFECRKKIYYETFEKRQAARRNYYQKNKEIIKQKTRFRWYNLSRKKRYDICKKRNLKRSSYLREAQRRWARKNRELMGRAYINYLIRYNCRDIIKPEDIPDGLAELYRLNLTLKRLIKEVVKC